MGGGGLGVAGGISGGGGGGSGVSFGEVFVFVATCRGEIGIDWGFSRWGLSKSDIGYGDRLLRGTVPLEGLSP